MAEVKSDYIPENAPVKAPKDTTKGSYEQSSEQQRDYKMVMKLLAQGKSSRKDTDTNWKQYRDFYNGKQWPEKRPAYRASPNINICRATIETIVPILTDTEPGFDLIPSSPEDYEFADVLSKAVRAWWSRCSMNHTLVECIYDSMIVDAGILKCVWNNDLEEGLGDIEVSVIDPNNIYVPEQSVDFTRNCSWTIERMWRSIGELKRKFPDKAHLIKSTGSTPEGDSNEEQAKSGEVVYTSPIDKRSSRTDLQNVESDPYDEYKMVEVLEAWLDDWSIEEYELEAEDGKVEKKRKRKYPRGKIVTVLPGCKVTLQSKPSPYADGRKPYVRLVDYLKPRSFWGTGEIEPLKEIQQLLNKTFGTIVDWSNKMINPVWILDDTAGVDPDLLTNQIGLVITKRQGTEVYRQDAPSIPAKIFEMYGMLQQLADQVSGVNDITQGRRPVGITSGEALQTMQEAAQTRIRLKERNLRVSLSRLGELVISRIMQYYTEPRMIKVVGEGTKWPEYFEFYIEPVETENGTRYKMVYRRYERDEEGDRYQRMPWQETSESKGMFDVQVQGGTSLPFLKEKRGTLALKLFERQVIDEQELLETLEWPRWEEILRRKQEQAQAQAQAAPQQGAQMPQTNINQMAMGQVR